ncbi:MAG: Lrp/AsnC family transcriptional regulator [Dehalococcoidales bacterium]|nr:Lrp/AsnC family transcriptional regulator [Dehalococcoidales bacterium]
MFTVDDLDRRLIKLLQTDAHRSSDVLAKKLQVSPATVRRRVRKLIKENVIRIQSVVDPEKVGLPLAVLIAFDVDHEKLDSIMQFLAKQEEVKWVATCTGRFDIMALCRFASTEELSEFVQSQLVGLDGLRDTETFVCLHVEKPQFTGAI